MITEVVVVNERDVNAMTAPGIAVAVVIGVVVEVTIMIKSLKLLLLLRETVIWFHS